jgi:hypothetical protein
MDYYKVTENHLERVREILKTTKVKSRSLRGEPADEVEILGEVIVEKWLQENGITVEDEQHCITHDYKLTQSGRTFEVKTKERQVPPKDSYEVSVTLYNNAHQNVNILYFRSSN